MFDKSQTACLLPPHLIRLIREVHLVVDLCCLVLNSLHLYMMWGVFSLAVSSCSLQPLQTVHSDRVASGLDKVGELLVEYLAAGEESCCEPHQLPPSFF